MRFILGFPLLAGVLVWPAAAQQLPPAEPQSTGPVLDDAMPLDEAVLEADALKKGEILVVANRLKGQVDAPQSPIMTLNEDDIAAYGAASLPDLLAALTPQTGSGRGRGGGMPVMLLNGQRIANFREMRNIPPEAIRRMEILPEEVALRYGYAPDQRVVNLILKPEFAALTGELEYAQPDRGGTSTAKLEASLFRVKGPGRLNLTGSVSHTSPLTEADRGVVQTTSSLPGVATDPDPAAARFLVDRSTAKALNATWAKGLGPKGLDGSIALNGAISRTDSLALSGLNTVTLVSPTGASMVRTFGDPLRRDQRDTLVQGGASFNKPLDQWQFSLTLDASHDLTENHIDRRADTTALLALAASGGLPLTGSLAGPLPAVTAAGVDTARIASDSVTSLMTVSGRPLRLPGGEIAATVKLGYAWSGIVSDDTRSAAGHAALKRGDLSAGFNLGIPLSSRREAFGAGIGDLTLNLSGGLNRLSDFGTLTDWSAGLTWGMTDKLSLQASYIVNQAAPSLTDLGNPVSLTLNVPVYDFSRGETALVTVTNGGNPRLAAEERRDIKLGVNWQVPFWKDTSLIAEYFRNASDNITAGFPVLTPAIEAAFPERVVRDAAGRLIALDRRAVTYASQKGSRLRWGLNFGGTIGKPAPVQAGRPGGEFGGMRPGGGMGRGGAGGPPPGMMGRGPMGRGGNGQGRWNLAVYHTVQFSNRVLVAPGLPVLDLLNGDALVGGGVARHSLEMEGGAFYKGIGLRLNGSYTGATKVNSAATNLRYGALAKLNLRLFADLGQQKWLTGGGKASFFNGARFQLKLDNILDARQRVIDQNGVVPISYQPDILDPQGRVLGVELRKQF